MNQKYYLDESGNTGDLVKKDPDLTFSNQPLFCLSCIRINKLKETDAFVTNLRNKYRIQSKELKTALLYKSKPELILDVFRYIVLKKFPFFIELVDKKYFICTTIVSHQIIPSYFTGNESDRQIQNLRILISDYLRHQLPDDCYAKFFNACLTPSEENLLISMNALRSFFLSDRCSEVFCDVYNLVDQSLDDYFTCKSRDGEAATKYFVPIPDLTKRGSNVCLLPHVPSLTNIIARVNLLHKGNIEKASFIHDKQEHFDELLKNIKREMLKTVITGDEPLTPYANFNIKVEPRLAFEDSLNFVGIQIADLLAGFVSRYFNDFLYLNKDLDDVYHEIYTELCKFSDPSKGIGLNMVIPPSYKEKLDLYHFYKAMIK